MNGYVYLDEKYARLLLSFWLSSGRTIKIDGIYDKMLELINTNKAIFISVDNVSVNTGTTNVRTYLSIYTAPDSGLVIHIAFGNTVDAIISPKDDVNKIGG